jgi:hypothetical protein
MKQVEVIDAWIEIGYRVFSFQKCQKGQAFFGEKKLNHFIAHPGSLLFIRINIKAFQ